MILLFSFILRDGCFRGLILHMEVDESFDLLLALFEVPEVNLEGDGDQIEQLILLLPLTLVLQALQ